MVRSFMICVELVSRHSAERGSVESAQQELLPCDARTPKEKTQTKDVSNFGKIECMLSGHVRASNPCPSLTEKKAFGHSANEPLQPLMHTCQSPRTSVHSRRSSSK